METLERSELIKLVLVIVLGATGTYLLLPHRHGLTRPRLAHQIGFGLATVAILVFTLLWKSHGFGQAEGDYLLSKAFFYLFGFSAVGAAILTIISRDPIHSALWFAAVVLSTSGLFLLAGAQFLAAGTVIVYAGAIIVTFLFVIMLAQKEGRAIYDRMARAPFWATFASFLLLFTLLYAVMALRLTPSSNPAGQLQANVMRFPVVRSIDRITLPRRGLTTKQGLIFDRVLPTSSTLPESKLGGTRNGVSHVAGLGATLFTEHLVTVELAGALLFAALIGALAIATPRAPIRPSRSDAAPTA